MPKYRCVYWFDAKTDPNRRFPDGYPEADDETILFQTRSVSGGNMDTGIYFRYATLSENDAGEYIVRQLTYKRAGDPIGSGNYDPDITSASTGQKFDNIEEAKALLLDIDAEYVKNTDKEYRTEKRYGELLQKSNGDKNILSCLSWVFGLRTSDSFVQINEKTIEASTLPHRPEKDEVALITPQKRIEIHNPATKQPGYSSAGLWDWAKKEIADEIKQEEQQATADLA